jgi:hypothetical protein
MAFSKGKQKDINLLPGVEQAAKLGKIKLFTTIISVFVVILLVSVSLLFVFLSYSEGQRAKNISSQFNSKQALWQQLSKTAGKINSAKANETKLKEIEGANQVFVSGLEKVRGKVPSGVTLISLELKSSSSLSLQAEASDPAEIYQLVEELKKESFFSQVNISSLVKRTDTYSVNLTLGVKP